MNSTQSTVKAFYTWRSGGIQFLAFPSGGGVAVVDELGRNYGSWQTVERFRKLRDAGEELANPLPGCGVRVTGSVYHNA